MLSPEWYEACTDQILILYSRLEDDILKDIVRRILKTGMVTDSAKWQAEMLEEAGLLYNDIMQSIAKYTSQTTEEVCLLFEDAGTEVMKNDNIIAESATGKELHLSDSKLKILKANYRNTLGNLRNLTNTTAMTSQAAFIAACNDAHMQITSGAFSYQEAVRNAIKRAVQGGLTVKYPTGHIDKLDVAVRRAALTGVGQTAAKISIMNAEEMDCDLMEITAHAGARPEHAKWQGKLVSRTGKNVGRIVDGVRVLSLADIGYGTGAGFRGWNCRHDWHPYFEGYSTLNYTDEELAKLDEKNIEYDGQMYSQYEISQMQRAQERKIRELKRQTVKMQDAADFATDPKLKELAKADHQAMSVKLKTAEKELKGFCKATGQDRDKFREQVLGFGRSEAQRAVWANKKSETNKQFEQKYGEYTYTVLTDSEKSDILKNKECLSNLEARKWYLAHDAKIPNLIDKNRSIEEQARQAFELRNSFRTITRDLMKDQDIRKKLDKDDPNKTFEELIQSKMQRKNMTRDEAIEDILKTATKTRSSVNKKLGLE